MATRLGPAGRWGLWVIPLILAAMALAAPGRGVAQPGGAAALPGWGADDPAAAWPALLLSCRQTLAALTGWAEGCAAAERMATDAPAADRRRLLEAWLTPDDHGPGLLTGYYEPLLRGALAPGGAFRTPLRAAPPDLAPDTLLPPRVAIEAGALDAMAPPLLWVDDPIDAFFLQIQGSGRVTLPDGRVLRLGYAGRNGQPYLPIGRLLIERGAIAREAMSMQAIRAWLAAAPAAEARALLHANPAYVFFRVLDGLAPEQGPIGTLGVPLTPGRSIAVDPVHVPLGAPVWIVTRDPVDGSPIRRLVLAQDTGGAIRGRGRGDLFWGWGSAAEQRAGLMQDREARMFVLRPRAMPPAPPGPATAAGSAAAARPLD
ncbi:MAG: MltA domain-containing protein [Acetobacteraceae bacterium]|nr:MltA domain-containing protein [Acetobacteraceae bacterium]